MSNSSKKRAPAKANSSKNAVPKFDSKTTEEEREAAQETKREAEAFRSSGVFSSGDAAESFANIRSELLAIREMLQPQ